MMRKYLPLFFFSWTAGTVLAYIYLLYRHAYDEQTAILIAGIDFVVACLIVPLVAFFLEKSYAKKRRTL